MRKRSEPTESMEQLREKIIGFGERSGRKSFYPELRERLSALERFRALLDRTNDAIVVTDVVEGRVTDANQATCRMLGYTREELLGRPVRELSTAIAQRISEQRPGQVASMLRARSGRQVPVEATVAFMGLGATHYAVAVARDVSERQQSERALRESEQRFRAVFEGAAIGIGVIDLQGLVQAANLELQSLLGRSADEVRGKPYLALIHPEDRQRADEHHRRLLRGDTDRARLELRVVRADGQTAWAQVSTSFVAGADDAPSYLVAAIQDISLRKRAQDALQFLSQASVRLASSLEITATLQSLPELAVPFLGDLCAICLRTSDGRCEQRGLVCHDPKKKSLAEKFLEGRPFASLVDEAPAGAPGGVPRLFPEASGVLRAAAGRDPARLELLGKLDFRSLMMIPLASGERPLGTLMLATGESGRRYGQFDLELAMEFGHRAALALENASLLLEAQEANRVKDEFLAVVSHELRTPLTPILGWVSLLQSKKTDSSAAAYGVTVIERNARALARIIDDLLSLTRIMAGKLQIDLSPIDLAPVIEAAVEGLRPSAHAKQVSIDVQCARGIPAVSGDATRLQQVIWNLVSNAVKYTPAGGKVQVRLVRAGPSAEISVSDTGRGISPEFLPHVFERFRQADSSITRAYGGLGLGLAIVRHLVELHGGTVRASSGGEGLGACFTVSLPLAGGDVVPGAPGPEPEPPTLRDVRVLLVEDDADTLELVGKVLQGQGAQVAVASSAREALAELERRLPDVLISDIAMPEEDGVALLKAIRESGRPIPAVALTALAREEDRVRALAAGFERYLVKPVDTRELLWAVASLAPSA
jgi:PAS domain S-box-containing protein